MMTVLLALALQPAEEEYAVAHSPLSEGDLLLFAGFVAILAVVFGFDMFRTWWETNQWKRDARRKRRQML
jgi:hypothetical protein